MKEKIVKIEILKAQIYSTEINFEYPNEILLNLRIATKTIKEANDGVKCINKIIELRDKIGKVRITIEEYK